MKKRLLISCIVVALVGAVVTYYMLRLRGSRVVALDRIEVVFDELEDALLDWDVEFVADPVFTLETGDEGLESGLRDVELHLDFRGDMNEDGAVLVDRVIFHELEIDTRNQVPLGARITATGLAYVPASGVAVGDLVLELSVDTVDGAFRVDTCRLGNVTQGFVELTCLIDDPYSHPATWVLHDVAAGLSLETAGRVACGLLLRGLSDSPLNECLLEVLPSDGSTIEFRPAEPLHLEEVADLVDCAELLAWLGLRED